QVVGHLIGGVLIDLQGREKEIQVHDAARNVFGFQLDVIADRKGAGEEQQHGGRGVAEQTPDRDKADRDHGQRGGQEGPDSAQLETEHAGHEQDGDDHDEPAQQASHGLDVQRGEVGASRDEADGAANDEIDDDAAEQNGRGERQRGDKGGKVFNEIAVE